MATVVEPVRGAQIHTSPDWSQVGGIPHCHLLGVSGAIEMCATYLLTQPHTSPDQSERPNLTPAQTGRRGPTSHQPRPVEGAQPHTSPDRGRGHTSHQLRPVGGYQSHTSPDRSEGTSLTLAQTGRRGPTSHQTRPDQRR